MAFRCGPELRAHGRWVVFGSSLGPIAVCKQYGVALQRANYNIKHAGIKGHEKTGMQSYENTKKQGCKMISFNRETRIQVRGNPSQRGGPSTEGPED